MDARLEAERLMNELRPFASQMLARYGEFVPFGGYIDSHGKFVRVGAESKGELSPAARLDQLTMMLLAVAKNRKPRALGYAANVTVNEEDGVPLDAIQVILEHKGGFFADVYFVYTLHEGKVTIDRTITRERLPSLIV
jgi:hypothetical protein